MKSFRRGTARLRVGLDRPAKSRQSNPHKYCAEWTFFLLLLGSHGGRKTRLGRSVSSSPERVADIFRRPQRFVVRNGSCIGGLPEFCSPEGSGGIQRRRPAARGRRGRCAARGSNGGPDAQRLRRPARPGASVSVTRGPDMRPCLDLGLKSTFFSRATGASGNPG